MMRNVPQHTKGVVLTRTNYGEADRIITFLTRDSGKLRLLAKGVRKEKSKLAGGIELFSISDIGFVLGRGDIGTLVSARLVKHYNNFLGDLTKVDLAYGALGLIHKFTTDDVTPEYFALVQQLLIALDEPRLSTEAIIVWWSVQLSNVSGHALNLEMTTNGISFTQDGKYIFDTERGGFALQPQGRFNASHIKYLRLALLHGPLVLVNVQGGQELASDLAPYLKTFVEYQF